MTRRRPALPGDDRGLRALSWALASVGIFCIVSPVVDWVLTNLPLEFSRLTWRYQAVGRLSQTLLTPMLGFSLLVGAGALSGALWLCRISGWLAIAGARALAGLTALLVLDMGGAGQQVVEEAAAIFRIGALRAATKFVLATAALSLLGWAGLTLAGGSQNERPGPADSVVFKTS